jgi:hypothetical protein
MKLCGRPSPDRPLGQSWDQVSTEHENIDPWMGLNGVDGRLSMEEVTKFNPIFNTFCVTVIKHKSKDKM